MSHLSWTVLVDSFFSSVIITIALSHAQNVPVWTVFYMVTYLPRIWTILSILYKILI